MVEALFEGEQRDYVRCHECGTVSYRKDQFRDLKLVVPSAAEEKKLEAPTALIPFSGAGHTLSGATTTTAATATTTAGSTAPPSADADGPSAAGSPPTWQFQRRRRQRPRWRRNAPTCCLAFARCSSRSR